MIKRTNIFQKRIAKEIKAFMESEGLTIYSVSQETGLHFNTVKAIVNATGYNIETLERLLNHYNIELILGE